MKTNDSGGNKNQNLPRKLRKILVEKKRRERIDVCLKQIKELLFQGTEFQNDYMRMEKADILENVVHFLQCKNLQGRTELGVSTQYRLGYIHCLREVTQVLDSICGESTVSQTLKQYMSNRLNNLGCAPATASTDPSSSASTSKIYKSESFTNYSDLLSPGLPHTEVKSDSLLNVNMYNIATSPQSHSVHSPTVLSPPMCLPPPGVPYTPMLTSPPTTSMHTQYNYPHLHQQHDLLQQHQQQQQQQYRCSNITSTGNINDTDDSNTDSIYYVKNITKANLDNSGNNNRQPGRARSPNLIQFYTNSEEILNINNRKKAVGKSKSTCTMVKDNEHEESLKVALPDSTSSCSTEVSDVPYGVEDNKRRRKDSKTAQNDSNQKALDKNAWRPW